MIGGIVGAPEPAPDECAGMSAAEALAVQFHEAYERLAPEHGYSTREASRKPWRDVPDNNRSLMIAVAADILGRSVTLEEDYGVQAQRAAENHLQSCNEWMEYYDEGESGGAERPAGDDPSFAPYDGCETCVIREALFAAYPVLQEGITADAQEEIERAHLLRIVAENPGIDVAELRAQWHAAGSTDGESAPA